MPFQQYLHNLPPVPESPTCAGQRQLPRIETENPPRHSGWQRVHVIRPDNAYRDEAPVDTLWRPTEIDWSISPDDLSPDHGEGPSAPRESLQWTPADTNNVPWEGGAKLIYYLLSATVQPLDGTGNNLPSVSNVHE